MFITFIIKRNLSILLQLEKHFPFSVLVVTCCRFKSQVRTVLAAKPDQWRLSRHGLRPTNQSRQLRRHPKWGVRGRGPLLNETTQGFSFTAAHIAEKLIL